MEYSPRILSQTIELVKKGLATYTALKTTMSFIVTSSQLENPEISQTIDLVKK